MAIINIQAPQILTPARNQMMWVFNSTNQNKSGFRYIFTIYDKNNNLVARLPVAKEPEYGYGYADISSIINDNLLYDIDTAGIASSIPNSIYEYKLNISETYLYSWDFIDNVFQSGNVGFYGTTQPQFVVGDTIEVYQDEPFTNSSYQGQANVISVTYSAPYWYVVINKPFGSNTPLEPGTIYYANRKKITNVGPTYSGYYAFNGRKTHAGFLDYTSGDYIISAAATSSTDLLLTDLPDNFYMTPDQDMWVNMFRGTESSTAIAVRFETSDGDILQYNNIWTSSYGVRGGQLAVGPGNAPTLLVISGAGPLIKSTTEYYDLFLVNSSNWQVSKKYRVNIDRRCKIEDYEILFMDKMGSFVSYAFQLRSKETFNVERKEYNQFLGRIETNGWGYRTQDAGSTIYSVNSTTELELNTNWMTDEMSVYFRQLIESPVTLLKDTNGKYYPVIVQDAGGETTRQKNKQLIRKTIKVRFANNEGSNI